MMHGEKATQGGRLGSTNLFFDWFWKILGRTSTSIDALTRFDGVVKGKSGIYFVAFPM